MGAAEIDEVAHLYKGHISPGLQLGFTHLAVVVGTTLVTGIVGPHMYSGHGCPGVQTGFTHLFSKAGSMAAALARKDGFARAEGC